MSIIGAQLRNETYLSLAKKGRYKVISLPTGRNACHKLNKMGIRLEKEIEVIQNEKHFPIVIRIDRTTLSIGHGMGFKIMVKAI